MNFQFLSEHEAELVEEMRRLGYAETYINRHRTIISQITGNASNYEWQSYADVFGWYWDTYQSPTYIRDIRAVVENLEAFHLHGKYPSGQKGSNSLCSRRDSYSRLNAKYRSVMDYYSVVLSDMDLQESTRYSALHKSSSFLLELQLNGEDSLNKVTEKGVLRCFFNNDRQIRGASCAGAVRRFLLQCVDFNSECQRIVAYVPRFRNSRKNIQYLSPEEVSLIRLVIDDAENTLCYKDRAIGMLLLYTGMRGSDVAHLCVGDIDWEKDVIRFRQQKTSETVELPLKTIVGNAKASHWLEDGLNIVQISYLLGHAQLQTTMVYLDISLEQKKEALATLEDEKDKNVKAKWKRSGNSLSAFCGLKEIK